MHRSTRRADNRGFILVVGLVIATGLMTLMSVGLTRSLGELSVADRAIGLQQEFYLAEAGVDAGLQWLRAQASPPVCGAPAPANPIQGFFPWCTLDPLNGAQALGRGTYTVAIEPDDNNPTSHVDLYRIRTTATVNGTSRIVSVLCRTESFARFQQFTQSDSGVWITGSGANGPVHTNGKFIMLGTPTFYEPASSVAPSLDCPYGPCTPKFYKGVGLGVPQVQLTVDLEPLKTSSLNLTGDTTVELNGQTAFVTNADQGWVNHPVAISATPALYVNSGTLMLTGGMLDGQLTMGSDSDILVTGPVRYACDPLIPYWDVDCLDGDGQVAYNDDMLGLVAQRNVVVTTAAPTTNMRVDAAVMTLDGKYYYEDYGGAKRGFMFRLGGFVAKETGYFRTVDLSSGTCVGGYCYSYWSYDKRLLNIAPPYYPTTGRYEKILWQEEEAAP